MALQLTDSHCHIQSVGQSVGEENTRRLWEKAGDVRSEDVLARAMAAVVSCMLCVGCTLEESELAIQFVKSRENLFASVGIHPHEAHHYAPDLAAAKELAVLATAPKVVAIGEIGLDYFYEHSDKTSQLQL